MALDAKQIQEPLGKLRKLLKKLPASPNAKQVHRLRTGSRRIEAMLPALSLDSSKNGRRILKQISTLRKRAGKVRDMDVLIDYLSDMSDDNAEKECSVQLLEHLGARRSKHAKKLHAAKQQYASQLRKRLKRTADDVNKLMSVKQQGRDNGSTTSTIAASALKLLSDLQRPARLGRTNLHPYRIKVKELRNLLQMAENADRQEFVKSLGEIKDAIGEWHDWEELLVIAKEVLDHKNCQLQNRLRKIADGKYENALGLAETMRRKFLHVGHKRSSHGVQAPAEPVW
ncbi:MAG: hypothetical protein DMG79_19680, partial [Acidobacteria bacterium]